MAVDVMLEV